MLFTSSSSKHCFVLYLMSARIWLVYPSHVTDYPCTKGSIKIKLKTASLFVVLASSWNILLNALWKSCGTVIYDVSLHLVVVYQKKRKRQVGAKCPLMVLHHLNTRFILCHFELWMFNSGSIIIDIFGLYFVRLWVQYSLGSHIFVVVVIISARV